MIETTIDIKGFKELDEALKEFPIKLQKNIIKDATKEGAKVIKRAAIAMAPVGKTGKLRRAIKIGIGKKRRNVNTITYIVGLNKDMAWYGRLVEMGAGAHIIDIRKKKALTIDGKVVGTKGNHPGIIHRKPFMRPAIDNYAGQAIEAIKKRLIEGIEKNLPFTEAGEDA
jgi:HK97 gp10 family phage protein